MYPFLKRTDKGIFVLAKTSNVGSSIPQNLTVALTPIELDHLLNGPARQLGGTEGWDSTMPLFEVVTHSVVNHWNEFGNCGIVAGATYPEEAARIRYITGPDVPFLIPGVGAQGQTAEEIVPKALRKGQLGVINSSRGSIYPKRNPGESMADAIRRSAVTLSEQIIAAQEIP
jgi:orotidine-5'-phosphate decarboxylase